MENGQIKILVVEDDNGINGMLQAALMREGYACVGAYSGTEALLHLKAASEQGKESERYALVILDLMLPGMEGQEVLKALREFTDVPVIVLSAKDALDTKVDLLTLGANDYMTKPFQLPELLVRVMVQLRSTRRGNVSSPDLSHRSLAFDGDKKICTVDGAPVLFTAQELKIMELFLRHPGRVFSKNEIYEYAWDDFYVGEDKTINVHISNIRQKLKQYTDEEYIETVWGLGFRLI